MSEDFFRIFVAVAVGVACLAFIVQAVVVFAIYRTARNMQKKMDSLRGETAPVLARLGPIMDKVGPVADKLAPVIERAGPVIDKIGPAVEKIGPAVERFGTLAERARPVIEKAGPVLDRAVPVVESLGPLIGRIMSVTEQASAVVSNADAVLEENRPKIAEIADQGVSIARTGRLQVERVGELVHNASDRALTRLEQIDHTVASTVDQVEQVGENMKRAVTRPVREISGIAAGISAVVSTLVKGSNKSSVASATQDEEMFI